MTESLSDLFAQYHGSLVRMLYRRTGDRDRSEEIAQEVFARAAVARPRSPRPWLFAVALNLLREEARVATRRARILELYRTDDPPVAPPPDEEVERGERVARIRAALDTLTTRDREALLLKAEGFSYEEISAATGLAKGAIGTTLARARRRLVAAYRDSGSEDRNDGESLRSVGEGS